MSEVEIRYTRPPDRTTIFRQQLVHRTDTCVVTLLEHADIERPITVRGAPVLEPGSPVVWFTFTGLWHDIGRFHTRDDEFTGYYANVLTPVHFMSPVVWETTDLFLDVWLDARGAELLDEAELHEAVAHGWVSVELGARARSEAGALLDAARAGDWPPAICREWTLDRARAALRDADGTSGGMPV